MFCSWGWHRVALLIVVATLMGVSAAHSQESQSRSSTLTLDEGPALQITDKKYDEERGDLVLVLSNRSDVSVTAFAVFFVVADSTGHGPTQFREQEFWPGDGIAPGASHTITVSLGGPGQVSSKFSARAARLDFEIRSDHSSYGNAASIDRVFERRVAYFVECNQLLERLKEASSGLPKSMLPQLRDEASRGQQARNALLRGPDHQPTQREQSRLAAVSVLGNLAEQTLAMVEAGQLAEQAVAKLEQLLEGEVAHRAKGFRSSDLERYHR